VALSSKPSTAKKKKLAQGERVGKDFLSKWNLKTSKSSYILTADKVGFTPRLFKRNKEGHFILIKKNTPRENSKC
jgi:hypothetical protein